MSKQTEGRKLETVTLIYGFERDGNMVKEVTIRRPSAGELKEIERMANQGSLGMDMHEFLLGRLADLAPDEVQSMDAEDYGKLVQPLEHFLQKVRPGSSGNT